MYKIRNDDISWETDLDHLKWFCDLCDSYAIPIIQGITPVGVSSLRLPTWSDAEILQQGVGRVLHDNADLWKYLLGRQALGEEWAVHGLAHTHEVSEREIEIAKCMLGGKARYYIAPFNEGYQEVREVCGLTVLPRSRRLEDMHQFGEPQQGEIVYLHSWRYDGSYYLKRDLEQCLQRIMNI